MNHRPLKIGTRESQLAVWQATEVKGLLAQNGVPSELCFISSEGDTDLHTPLYEMGVRGIFTRTLDSALLRGDIDIAVHSFKDVPTIMAKGITEAAVLPRGPHADVYIPNPEKPPGDSQAAPVIGTGSLRRKAQWLHRYPNSTFHNMRGNIQTRLRKVSESNWNGGIFAAAALHRLGIAYTPEQLLHWMLPAPAQGAVVVVCREADAAIRGLCAPLNHQPTEWCTHAERHFLHLLKGGCTAPIGAYAEILNGGAIRLACNLCTPEGELLFEQVLHAPAGRYKEIAEQAAQAVVAIPACSQFLKKMHSQA